MTIEEAYERLRLISPAVFALQQGGERQRGATTLMCVQATLCVLDQSNVVLVGRSSAHAEALAKLVLRYLELLDPQIEQLGSTQRWPRETILSNEAKIYWLGPSLFQRGGYRGFVTQADLFIDMKSEGRLSNFLQEVLGPFSSVTSIRVEWAYEEEEPHYNAYDRRGQFLLELTKEGARTFSESYGVPVVVEYRPEEDPALEFSSSIGT